jgi:hypothetical protein
MNSACLGCGSKDHFIRSCPNKKPAHEEKVGGAVNAVLLEERPELPIAEYLVRGEVKRFLLESRISEFVSTTFPDEAC